MLGGVTRWAEFIKWEHTVFALPFGLAAMFLAAGGVPDGKIILGVVVCLVGARTAAMAFNRLADWQIDQKNPRTAGRSALVSRGVGYLTLGGGVLGLVAGAGLLNPLCLILSPVAVGVVFFYSLTKRFTWATHGFLGVALGVAPVGGWLAVRGSFDSWVPIGLGVAVGLWVAGFDLIYALQDREFDQREGWGSFPAKFGEVASLRVAAGLHGFAVLGLGAVGWGAGLGWRYGVTWGAMVGVLVLETWWAREKENRGKAFFQANAAVSLLVLLGVMWEILQR